MRALLLSVALFAVLAQAALAQKLTLPEGLATRIADGETVDVLAIFDEYPDLSGADALATKVEKGEFVLAALTQYRRGYQPVLDTLTGDSIAFRELWSAGALYVPDADSTLLSALEKVADAGLSLAPSDAVSLDRAPASPHLDGRARSSIPWGLDYINARKVWASGVHGEGVVIGGQDTGYDWDHPALVSTYRGYDAVGDSARHAYNWYDAVKRRSPLNRNADNPCGYNTTEACDDGSHGTHTMGSMVGAVGGDTIGVAPGAEWIGCRNMDRGDGTPQQYLECFQWFLAPSDLNGEDLRPELAPDVIANSWYCPLSEGCDPATYPAFDRATAALRAAGVVVVVSAGNSGPGCNTVNDIPARVDGVIAVAAHDASGRIAGFSSRGGDDPASWPDIAAPGVDVRSAIPPAGFANFSGTSMAGPHVAGVVALMISANPALRGQVDSIEALLLRAADPAVASGCGSEPPVNPNQAYGHGTLNAAAAVALARRSTAGSESVAVRVAPNPVSDVLRLRHEEIGSDAHLRVFDTAGRLVTEHLLGGTRTEVLTAAWSSGVYIWTVSAESGVASGRIVKR